MEEHSAFCGQVRGKSQAKPDHGHKDKTKVKNDSQFKKSARVNKGGRYDFYTPLSAPRVHILEEASNSNLLTLRPPGHSPNNTDRTKHCRYHRNHGHTTEECRTLRDRIEELVQAGHLGQYIQRQQGHRGGYNGQGRGRGCGVGTRIDQPSRSQQNTGGAMQAEVSQEIGLAPLRGVINTIAGGFAGGGSSNSARSTFVQHQQCPLHHLGLAPKHTTDDDYTGVCPNQDDPMVIVLEVANWEVHKTLIDQGSSVDILYWLTFLRVDIPHSLIQPHTEPLVSFAGERVHTQGHVNLLTTFGASPDSRWIMIRYLLVKANTSYNIIIRRSTLNQLGAVVSTPHLTKKFPGSDGKIISVRANQKIAQQ
ncbi:uncharacterized protein LOC109814899 [Cajanus cajan]|uniref:uncharacterized protein LOC109814899 n=1 Tax=Cajanus cajan TaxID=3821 RepID=UPI00098DC413|nr:uncharacterized protein LOC109814899 [Cajanus cajan]